MNINDVLSLIMFIFIFVQYYKICTTRNEYEEEKRQRIFFQRIVLVNEMRDFELDPQNAGFYLELTLINDEVVKTDTYKPEYKMDLDRDGVWHTHITTYEDKLMDVMALRKFQCGSESYPAEHVIKFNVKYIDNCNKI